MELTQADVDRARAEGRTEGHAAGLAEGKQLGLAEGAKGERARIKGIMGSEEAKGRDGLASHLAYETDSSAESAASTLKASAKAAGGLEERARETERGLHFSGGDKDASQNAPTIDAAAIYAARKTA